MKKLPVRKLFGIILFFLITAAAMLLLRPAYRAVSSALESRLEEFRSRVEELTGFSVSYQSLSPAVLTGIRVKNILLVDSFDGQPVLRIKKAALRYRLTKFLSEGAAAVKDLTVDGLVLEIDRGGDARLFEKMSSLFRAGGSAGEPAAGLEASAASEKPDEAFDLERFAANIPFDVFVRNVSVRYRNGDDDASLFLRRLTLAFSESSRLFRIDTAGALRVERGGSGNAVSARFSADGSVMEKLSGSAVTFRISDISAFGYAFKRFNVLIGYNQGSVDFRTIQNAYPFFLRGTYNLDSEEVHVSVQTDNLRPGSVVSSGKSSALLAKVKDAALDVSASAQYNLRTKALRYDSEGRIRVPDGILPGSVNAAYALHGTASQLTVDSLSLGGGFIDADFYGNYIFDGMRLSGAASVNSLTLPNGGVVSTELYFDPLERGFMGFAPQLMLDEKSFTALQLMVVPQQDSIDFTFEASDYSHEDAENPGIIQLNGSYLSGTKYVQANLSASELYLDSIAKTGAFFMKEKPSSSFSFLAPYMLSGEIFASSDLQSVSFNVPYLIAANTKKDNQFVYLSLDGNGSSVNISRLAYISDGGMAQLSAQLERSPDSDDAFFVADMNIGSIPYHFTGSLMPGRISVGGDYGFALDVSHSGGSRFDGSFFMENFPLDTAGAIFTASADVGFSVSPEDGADVRISRFEAEEIGEKFFFKPRLAFSGQVSKYGAFLDGITYSDMFSSLAGNFQLLWNSNGGVFDSANMEFHLKNPLAPESISITAGLSNPGGEPFSAAALKNSFYMNAQAVLTSVGLNRIASEESDNNYLSATVIASGTLENPYIGVDVEAFSLMTAGKTIRASGSAYVEERNLTVDSIQLDYNKISVSDITALFHLDSFTGQASAVMDTTLMRRTVHVPLELTVSDTFIPEGRRIPTEFVAHLASDSVSGSFFLKQFPLDVTVLHSAESTSVFTSEEIGLAGSILKNGDLDFSVAEGKPVQFNLAGNVSGRTVSLSLDNVSVDVGQLFTYFDIEKFKVYKGILSGSLFVSGLKADPEFDGSFVISNADFSLPTVVPSRITVPQIPMTVSFNTLEMPEVRGLIKNSFPIFASMQMYFNGWSFDRLDAHVYTPKSTFAPADLNVRLAEFVGDASIDLNLAFSDRILDVSGDVAVRNTTARAKTKEIAAQNPPPERSFYVRTDLNITFGQHVTFRFDPLLRAVFVPDTRFKFRYDMEGGTYSIDGDISFRSGDIAYLSRNFYLKNGSMRFTGNEETFNPLISLQAETRERDEDGNDVRIILTADNQYLLDFNPQFSSVPAKSETEIRAMLGQLAVGDSENAGELLLAAGDYALQSTIGRTIENKLRDFLNFDILSVRTMVLQNALKLSLSGSLRDSEKTNLEIGNFLDNSTVYIGKYFGSALYADALLHWSYDETRIDDRATAGGLVFTPEFGLELESPFASIRWNMAPDIDAMMNNRIVSSTSVTLSWKFSF